MTDKTLYSGVNAAAEFLHLCSWLSQIYLEIYILDYLFINFLYLCVNFILIGRICWQRFRILKEKELRLSTINTRSYDGEFGIWNTTFVS